MGITARSAWESVKRHFRELGTDTQSSDFTVVGIGDMSGDVFGNGMLLSPHIRLVGAFDHRHVFIDPDPDPAASFAERRPAVQAAPLLVGRLRPLADLQGGGVVAAHREVDHGVGGGAGARDRGRPAHAGGADPRAAARPGRPAVERRDRDLRQGHGENNGDVGDKANDAVRIDARELRCRVVEEGGNLGFTQRGRIEYALAGGSINTDAIDNAGGVNCSDHEVNIKILLDAVVTDGDLTRKQRNRLLADMTDAVAERVLRGGYLQTQALSLARAQAPAMLDVHDRMMRALEQTGDSTASWRSCRRATRSRSPGRSRGLTQPELAVLLAYSKITLYAELLDSDLPEDPALAGELAGYFPDPLPERFADRLERHRLRREIVATRVTNGIVDRAGTTFVFRLKRTPVQARPTSRRPPSRGTCSACGGCGPTSRRSTCVSTRRRRSRCCSRPGVWSSAPRAGCCGAGRGRWTSAPRSALRHRRRGGRRVTAGRAGRRGRDALGRTWPSSPSAACPRTWRAASPT